MIGTKDRGWRTNSVPTVQLAGAAAVACGGFQGFEDLCGKLTHRQLRALGCRRNQEGRSVPPSDSTFFRVISRLDAAQFELVVGSWLLEQEVSVLARLAVDGKVLRGSGRNDGRPLQLLSAVTHRLRLTLGQIAIAEKSNEIPALKPLLQSLPDLAGSPEEIGLCGCWQVIAGQRERAWLGRPPKPARVEIGDYATSLSQPQQDDQELLKIIRDHGAASENGSHYRPDNTFGEDACQTSKRGGALSNELASHAKACEINA